MAKIGLIEIKARNHELSGLCKISNTSRHRITVFTTTTLFPQVEEELEGKIDDYEWIFDQDNESTYSYLKRVERICSERIDIVIIKSLRNSEFVFFNPKSKQLAFIDDLNYWFRDTKSLSIYVKKLMDKNNITTTVPMMANAVIGPVLRRIILSHLDGVIVEYPPFKQYIHRNLTYRGKVFFFPNRPFEGVSPHPGDTKIRFIIPGRIQEIRRDYQLVIRVFQRLFAKYQDLIGLDLVGEPVGDYGQRIISQCEDLLRRGYDVFCPKEYVSATFVKEKLTKTDVVISPMQVTYRSGCVEETYTITKPSGIFSDVIPYAKPCVVPHTYNVADEIKTSFPKYKDEADLERLLGSLINDRNRLKNLQDEALKNSQKFSLEKLHDAFDNMVEELIMKPA